MSNDTRAMFWRRFLLERLPHPAPERLRAQLAAAELFDFCDCGCNSFAVRVPALGGVPPLAEPHWPRSPTGRGNFAVFEADYWLTDGGSLELVLMTDDYGHLGYVEINCNGNSEPVPDEIAVAEPAYHVRASEHLLP